MSSHKFKEGEKVIYKGLIATIESLSTYFSGGNCYGLVADENSELTCTASEQECELYTGQDIDQSEALSDAQFESSLIMMKVDRLTDKYNH